MTFPPSLLAAGLTLAALAAAPAVHAQDAAKKDLAVRIVQLQKASDMDNLVGQLAAAASQNVVAAWMPKLDALPQDRQRTAAEQLDAELKRFNEDNVRVLKSRLDKTSLDVLVPAYTGRFAADELKQVIAFLESPAIKKFFAANPQISNALAQKLMDAARPELEARMKAFDLRASQILGLPAAGAGKKR